MKLNNTVLAIVLAVLIGVFLLVKFLKIDRSGSNFDANVISVDTTQVVKLVITPKNGTGDISIEKSGNGWKVSNGTISDEGNPDAIAGILGEIARLKANRLAANSEDKWIQYEVTGELGSRLQLIGSGGKVLNDIYIGKYNISQMPQQGGAPPGLGGGQGIKMTSFFRLNGEDEVYAGESFLPMALTGDISQWRNSKVLEMNGKNIIKVEVTNNQQQYTLERTAQGWMMNDTMVDSNMVDNYLRRVSYLNSTDFVDDQSQAGNEIAKAIIHNPVDGNVTISCKAGNEMYPFMISTSLTGDKIFGSDTTGIYANVFDLSFIVQN